MKILDFVNPGLVVPELLGKEKAAVLRELAFHVASHGGPPDPSASPGAIDAEELIRVLTERERLASTAIGDGLAIPHGKLGSVQRLIGCIGRSQGGIDFESMDGSPTYIFFVLVGPEQSTGIHLKALARISRLFKEPEFRGRLMQARGAAEMYRVIADEDAKY